MKRVLFTVFVAVMLILLAMSAGCTEIQKPQPAGSYCNINNSRLHP